MVCYTPLQGYESKEVTVNGRRKTVFNRGNARAGGFFSRSVPCHRCFGCRIQYSREWALRCLLESSLHKHSDGTSNNSFITLTYNDDFLPFYGSLRFSDWTKFLKRFRKRIEPLKIRFYMGPEYGDLNFRPHYHALIFGFDFPDKYLFMTRRGHKLYRSDFLEDLWTDPLSGKSMGYCSIGDVTFQSAAYVARYMMKKVKGEDIDSRYERFNLETGEVFFVEPEVARMSNRPGIGKAWFDEYSSSIYVKGKDFLTVGDGRKFRPPKYFDRLLERVSVEQFEALKAARQLDMRKYVKEYTPERLAEREKCHIAKVRSLKRSL